jgi:hypothetical protein
MAELSAHTPRYLTGDKAGLNEFLGKFDVSPDDDRTDC